MYLFISEHAWLLVCCVRWVGKEDCDYIHLFSPTLSADQSEGEGGKLLGLYHETFQMAIIIIWGE